MYVELQQGEAGERGRSHILKYFLCLNKGPELYPEGNEEPLKDFNQKNGIFSVSF